MEMNLREIKDRLMADDEEFSRLAREHFNHERRLEQLSSKSYLTVSEQVEEVTLKKRKLSLKDQMEKILQRYKKESALSP